MIAFNKAKCLNILNNLRLNICIFTKWQIINYLIQSHRLLQEFIKNIKHNNQLLNKNFFYLMLIKITKLEIRPSSRT